jgi:hypothetical protein
MKNFNNGALKIHYDKYIKNETENKKIETFNNDFIFETY